MEQLKNDAAGTAWHIIKVGLYIVRFWIGGFCVLAFMGAALDVAEESGRGFDGAPFYHLFGFGFPAAIWHALILLIAAFLIWPQRYNPILRLSALLLRRQPRSG